MLITSPLYGQKDRMNSFQIGLNLTPDLNFRTLSIISNSEGTVPKAGVTLGVNTSYYFKEHFSLEAGINYAFRNYQRDDLFQDSEQYDPRFPDISRHHLNFQYIEVPVLANFFTNHKKLRFITSLGVSSNIFLNLEEKTWWIYPDKVVEWNSPYSSKPKNKISFSPIIALGLDYQISNKLNLRLQPTARYILPEKSSVVRAFSIGLNFGTYYRFSKE